uniref:POU domain protein n=1 Tax=Trichobilharzia regenti TaxID=157069 RepID=A0AA85KF28_TRIRE|nr:unnamed protein product [Trichobilharzia regenti]
MNGIPAFKNYLPVNTFDANNGNRFPHFKSISPSSNDSNGQLSNFTSFPNDTESQQEDTSSPCVWWNDCSPLCSFNCPIHSTSTMTNITHNTFDQLSLDGLHKFVEIFKQKRIQLGITQAEVGRALGEINVCSFGCLSQSTICRFESLSLSPSNMLALKPVLEIWLKQMEEESALNQTTLPRQKSQNQDPNFASFKNSLHKSLPSSFDISPTSFNSSSFKAPTQNRRRRRTSISEADKYFLESFFHTVDCRPTTEQMIQLASQLNMTKNVIRVWFCNQRQKQKRLLKLPSTSL